MLKLKPRLDLYQHQTKLLRWKRCTICRNVFVGHFSARQCSDLAERKQFERGAAFHRRG